MRPEAELADVLRALGSDIERIGLNTHQLRHLSAIKKCRTTELGGHVDKCDDCGRIHISYNSCRNRHCPKCQGHKREEWMQARVGELLPVPYFQWYLLCPIGSIHWQYNIQNGLRFAFCFGMGNTANIFREARSERRYDLYSAHLGTKPEPASASSLHCSGGGGQRRTVEEYPCDGKYLFTVKGLSKMFRAKYVSKLRKENLATHSFTQRLFEKEWVVYAKRPFGNTHSVIEYLGRYTHKVAISNHRILSVDDDNVSFEFKDYRKAGKRVL